MITKIDIQKFGLFSDYIWSQNIGNDSVNSEFKKLNIIYGRNYSGKTTLSRIIKCVGDGKLHEKYTDGEFTITNADGSTSSNTNLTSPYSIRVYNTDFVRENLKFLYDEDGDIEPFTLLGSENQEIQNRIDEITNLLGSVDSAHGLLFDIDRNSKLLETARRELREKESTLNNKLTNKANREIKNNPCFIKQGNNYNVSNIQREIDEIIASTSNFALTEAEKDAHKAIINEQAKPDINDIIEIKPGFSERETSTRKIIGKKISVTNTIQELVNDVLLQSWVEQGRGLHRDKRDKCAFCGGDIRESRWQEIDAHFSRESEELKTKIRDEIRLLEGSKLKLQTFLESKNIRKDRFYTTFHTEYDTINAQWDSTTKRDIDNIDLLLTILHKRDAEIFNVLTLAEIEDNSEDVLKVIKQFNELIRKHNSKTSQLETDKDTSRQKLRFSEISAFINDIDYSAKKKEIEDSKAIISTDEESLKILVDSINALELEKKRKSTNKKMRVQRH